jgi:hypothetical protein
VPGDELTRLQGLTPYWRLALTRAWGAHNLMVGTAGMLAKVANDPADPSSRDRFRDLSLDAQYQYLLDPHAVTMQFVVARQRHTYPDAAAGQAVEFVDASGGALAVTNAADTTNVARLKASYVYQAKYGGSLAWFNLTGSTNSANQSSGFDPSTTSITTSDPAATVLSTRVNGNLSGNPGMTGRTYEAFYNPVQNIRIGAQFTAYSRYNGAKTNYDGFGRDAKDNNSWFVYMWAAY